MKMDSYEAWELLENESQKQDEIIRNKDKEIATLRAVNKELLEALNEIKDYVDNVENLPVIRALCERALVKAEGTEDEG